MNKKDGKLQHLRRHYQRNYIWVWLSFATYGLAYFTYTIPHGFDGFRSPFDLLSHLQDPMVMAFEIFAATYSLIVSLWNLSQFWAKPLRSAFLMFAWSTFALGLLAFDIFNRVFSIGLPLSFFMVALIFETSRIGNNKERL